MSASIAKKTRTWQEVVAATAVLNLGAVSRSNLEEALKTTVIALRVILPGAAVEGRWIDCLTQEIVDDAIDPAGPPDGYYDESTPPEQSAKGDDHPCWNTWEEAIELFEPTQQEQILWDASQEQWVRPAVWEPYTAEEQTQWLETCADQASCALDTVTSLLES